MFFLSPVNFNASTFWKLITGLDTYNTSASYQTIIIHPVIITELKIIYKILLAQAKTTKDGKVELEILWSMVIGAHRSHFSHLTVKRFYKVIHLRSGLGNFFVVV